MAPMGDTNEPRSLWSRLTQRRAAPTHTGTSPRGEEVSKDVFLHDAEAGFPGKHKNLKWTEYQ